MEDSQGPKGSADGKLAADERARIGGLLRSLAQSPSVLLARPVLAELPEHLAARIRADWAVGAMGARTIQSLLEEQAGLSGEPHAIISNRQTAMHGVKLAHQVTEATREPRKRGRPQTIPDSRKDEAARAKASGSNRDAAGVIYATKFPTKQQVKNVSSILREHRKKLNPSGPPIPGTPNAGKSRG